MNQPNLNTVYPDILIAIFEFLNPWYTRILRMAIKGLILPLSLQINDEEKRTRLFYQFAEDYAEHTDFHVLFPTINFRNLARFNCYRLHKRFVVFEEDSLLNFINNRLLSRNDMGKFIASNANNNLINPSDIGKLRNMNINAYKRCKIIIKLAAMASKYKNVQLFIQICNDGRIKAKLSHILNFDKEQIWEIIYSGINISDNGNDAADIPKHKTNLLLWTCNEYSRKCPSAKISNFYILQYYACNNMLADFCEFAKASNITHSFPANISDSIAKYGDLKFCEWAAANISAEIYKTAAKLSINGKVLQTCINMEIDINYRRDRDMSIETIHELCNIGYSFGTIKNIFNFRKLTNIEDLEWANDAGYSTDGIFGEILRLSKVTVDSSVLIWAINKDLSINWQNDNEWTLIINNVYEKNYTCLLPYICRFDNADMYIANFFHNAYISTPLSSFITSTTFMRKLIELQLLRPNNYPYIHQICEFWNVNFHDVKYLVSLGFELSEDMINYACRIGDLPLLEWLVDDNSIKFRKKTISEYSLWCHAWSAGNMNIIEWGIKCGIKFNIRSLIDASDGDFNKCKFMDINNYAILQRLAKELR